MVVHFSAAAHVEALGDILSAVATAAREIEFFEQVNVLAFHLSVADEIERRRKTCKTRADDIGGFFIYAFGFFGMRERFVSACGIIHNFYLRDGAFFSLPVVHLFFTILL